MLTDNPAAPLILVVEDDDNHAELIQRSFDDAEEEYRLEIAGTLLEAWKVIERIPPNLVLTDYRLPDGDGNELVVMVNDSCPVVIMTSHGNEQVAVKAMKTGAQDYVVKTAAVFSGMSRIAQRGLREWALIQERIQTDKQILIVKRDWERTFDAVPDLIAIIDVNHTITRANKAIADRCGLSPAELIGRSCHEVIHGSSRPHNSCPHIRTMQDGICHTEQIEEKQLNSIFDVTVSPLYNTEGKLTACVHIARDITENKRAEERRQKLEQQFQQTQKLESLGVLAGGIAHDFNNILTIILGHCFMAKEDFDLGTADKSHIHQIENAANRAADLCRQMLAYAGNSPLLYVQVDLCHLVDETVAMLHSAIKKNVTIKSDLKGDAPKIFGDSAQIQQVVMNLIINAAEAIGDMSGTIRVTLQKNIIREEHSETDFKGNAIPDGRYACLEISDTGCGIDEETRIRLFEPFFTTKFAGRGLGMSAVLGIIQSHDGALQLISSPGAGATFKVYFPLSGSIEIVEAEHTGGSAPSNTVDGTILIVDDEEALRTIGAALLNAMGFSTITAANGREALEIYRDQGSGIDLILLDLVMPEMGGVETYHELRTVKPDVPIIFCSGYGIEGILGDIAADTYAGAIQKPYNPGHLRSTMLDFIEKTRPPFQ